MILGTVVLIIGLLFAMASYQMNGPPWGFRDRSAIFVEVIGTAELKPSEMRKTREGITKNALKSAPGTSLFSGDEIRVSAFSMARAALPNAEIELLDGAHAVLEKKRWLLKRGLIRVIVKPGKHAFTVGSSVGSARLAPGSYRLTADGNAGGFFIYVEDGTAFIETPDGKNQTAEQGSLIQLSDGDIAVLDAKAKNPLSTRCKREGADAVSATRVISGKTGRGTQLFINGKLTYADEKGEFKSRLPPGDDVVVFARSAAGANQRVVLKCGTR